MPTYSFICPTCGRQFEEHLHFDEDPHAVSCPAGHGKVQRVYAPPPVVFKGSGYYITDNLVSKKEAATS